MTKTFYITTPIYYPSAKLHIGHAYSTTMADTMRRYKDMQGYETYFLTGSDEHGMKIQRAAEKAGMTPKAYVDEIVLKGFQGLWDKMMISNDQFIRTTDPAHVKAVQKLFQIIYDKGDIYLSSYEGPYCTSCETFFTEHQLVDGNHCPDCGKEVEILKEESYFFKMSHYADQLLDYIDTHPDFIQPVSRRNEMIAFIKQGLEDLCISRTTFDWGVPVPIKEEHVIYVWFDALFNYISALGWDTEDDSLYQKFWPADIHVVGKDIARFHAIIWPTILMAAGFPLPKQVFAHGWLLVGGGKMSKSKGNVVDPFELIEKYGVDAVRYFLLREVSSGQDGNYSEVALVDRINSDLANDYGNLVSRSIAMIDKYFDGLVPAPAADTALEEELRATLATATEKAAAALDRMDFPNALEALWQVISRANKYIDETTPWVLAKSEDGRERLATVLYHLAEVIRAVTTLLMPFMPALAPRCGAQLGYDFAGHSWQDGATWGLLAPGTRVQKGEALFPRIDPDSLNLPAAEVKKAEAEAADAPAIPAKPMIRYEDFEKLDIRLAKVKDCKPVEKADRLLHFTLDVDGEERTVLSGIRKFYPEPERLIGKQVVLLANLEPRKIRGIMSHGMLLSVATEDDSALELLQVEADLPSGSRIS